MSKEKVSETPDTLLNLQSEQEYQAAPSTLKVIQSELKKGGDVLDNFNHQLTQAIYDKLSTYNVLTDLDKLWDIVQESVSTGVSVWSGGSTEPIVSHDAKALDEEMKKDNPDLDTRKLRNDPLDNLALTDAQKEQIISSRKSEGVVQADQESKISETIYSEKKAAAKKAAKEAE
jgi:hypothetical protein